MARDQECSRALLGSTREPAGSDVAASKVVKLFTQGNSSVLSNLAWRSPQVFRMTGI